MRKTNLFKEYKEQLLYIVFGVLTTIISIIVYAFFTEIIILDVLLANIISWIVAVFFAFVTNRLWVFTDPQGNLLKQILLFYSGRIITLFIEEIILWIFIKQLELSSIPVKCVAQISVIILNYFISKYLVFRQKN